MLTFLQKILNLFLDTKDGEFIIKKIGKNKFKLSRTYHISLEIRKVGDKWETHLETDTHDYKYTDASGYSFDYTKLRAQELLNRLMKDPSQLPWNKTKKATKKSNGAALGRDEAIKILGLATPINNEKVLEAHKRIIRAVHPDTGGTNYLAQQVNLAKDMLLK